MNIKSYEEYVEEARKQGQAQQKADEAASNAAYDVTKTNTQNTYNKQIQDTKDSYDELYRENSVQKLINEREIAENMANLGLTDSGLNRTQQTAVQLSYANQKGKLDTSRQKAVDSLASELAAKISEIESNKALAAENIRSNYEKQYASTAANMYNNAIENERKLQETIEKEKTERLKNSQKAAEKAEKEAKEAAYIIKTNKGALSYNYVGSLKDNGVSVYYTTDSKGNKITRYVDNNSGKVTEISSDTNPYTFTRNTDAAKGVFSNGYQPNNIGGKKLVDTGKTIAAKDKDGNLLGRNQKIFSLTTKDGWFGKSTTKYYTWNGAENVYSEIEKDKDGDWDVVQEKVGSVEKVKV